MSFDPNDPLYTGEGAQAGAGASGDTGMANAGNANERFNLSAMQSSLQNGPQQPPTDPAMAASVSNPSAQGTPQADPQSIPQNTQQQGSPQDNSQQAPIIQRDDPDQATLGAQSAGNKLAKTAEKVGMGPKVKKDLANLTDRDSDIDSALDDARDQIFNSYAIPGGKSLAEQQQDIVKSHDSLKQTFLSKLDDDREAIANSKIDPDHFWHSKSTFQQVLGGVGVLFSSIGSGITGQPNLAMKIISDGIDRDMQSQKQDYDKLVQLHKVDAQGLEQLNGQEMQDLGIAASNPANVAKLTAQRLEGVQHLVDLQKQKSTSPEQQAALQELDLKLKQAKANIADKWADANLKNAEAAAKRMMLNVGKPLNDAETKSLNQSGEALRTLNELRQDAKDEYFGVQNKIPYNDMFDSPEKAAFRSKLDTMINTISHANYGSRQSIQEINRIKKIAGSLESVRTKEQWESKMDVIEDSMKNVQQHELDYYKQTHRYTGNLGQQQQVPAQSTKATQSGGGFVEGKQYKNNKTGKVSVWKNGTMVDVNGQ